MLRFFYLFQISNFRFHTVYLKFEIKNLKFKAPQYKSPFLPKTIPMLGTSRVLCAYPDEGRDK
jgi:hypothetical protein